MEVAALDRVRCAIATWRATRRIMAPAAARVMSLARVHEPHGAAPSAANTSGAQGGASR